MLNQVSIMGRIVRDPELRRTSSGIAVTSFTLAVDRDYTTKDSDERETDFIDIVAWRASAEYAVKYIRKGDMVAVSGRIQVRCWTDQDGNKRRTTEVNAESVYGIPRKREEPAQFTDPPQIPTSEVSDFPPLSDVAELPFEV